MKKFAKLTKLKKGDKVGIISPSFAAPGRWPHVHQLGLSRIREVFGLEPVEFPATSDLNASIEEKMEDLVSVFSNQEIKAVITSLGGDIQVSYVKKLDPSVFQNNPKPFFGYSDSTHFANFLWLNGIPSFYGGTVFTEFAMQKEMDELTVRYLKQALFGTGEKELEPAEFFNDVGLSWSDEKTLNQKRRYESNEGWIWDGSEYAEGITWGGCLESVDELLRHNVQIPSLEDFKDVILFFETSEEIPSHSYVYRFFRALGERGILSRAKGLMMGRPKAWEFGNERSDKEKSSYRNEQRSAVTQAIRAYNKAMPVVQNLDFGHTSPQICLPYGMLCKIDPKNSKITSNWG